MKIDNDSIEAVDVSGTVGEASVNFKDNERGLVGFFSVDKLREALDLFSEQRGAEHVYLRLAPSENDDGEERNLLLLSDDSKADSGVTVAPRYLDSPGGESYVDSPEPPEADSKQPVADGGTVDDDQPVPGVPGEA